MYLIYIIRDFSKRLSKDHVSAYSAQAAFFIMLSFFPFMMLLLSLVQYLPIGKQDIFNVIKSVTPVSFKSTVIMIVDELYDKTVTVVSLSAVVAVWSSARGIMSIAGGLNSVNGVSETRNYIFIRIRAAFYTVLFIITLLLTFGLLIFGNWILGFIEEHIPGIQGTFSFLIQFRSLIMVLVLMFFFTLMYKFLPNRKAGMFAQFPGALFTAIGWMAFSFGFSIYINYFTDFSKIYGNLTTIIVAMLWLYISMYILLIGAEINSYFATEIRLFQVRRRKKSEKGEK